MPLDLQNRWSEFLESRPGRRFQDRYHRRRNSEHPRVPGTGYANAVVGSAVALLGIFFIPAPGPGWAVIFLGLGLISGEYLPLAKLLDRVEFRVQAYVTLFRRRWAKDVPMTWICVGTSIGAIVLLIGSIVFLF